jgi:transcriptional regulator with XRE-family HTH domain
MNAIEQLQTRIPHLLPNATMSLTPPINNVSGVWVLDIKMGDRCITVQWAAEYGFGLSDSKDGGYGEGPDEVFHTTEEALNRIKELTTTRARTSPSFAVLLSRLRERRGITQQQLADRLGITQATVSGIERRDDVQVSTLCRIVECLGGFIEIIAHFPDGNYTINVDGKSRKRSHIFASKAPQRSREMRQPPHKNTPFERLQENGALPQAIQRATAISRRGSIIEMDECVQ